MIKKIIIGLIAGLVSGLFATGGGMIVVPALVYLLHTGEVKARATSVFVILPMVITSGIFYYKNDFIDWKIGLLCALGRFSWRIFGSKIFKKNSRIIFKIIIYRISNLCVCKDDNFVIKNIRRKICYE